jgi:hypothetical protein
VFSKRGVVGLAKSKVTNKTNYSLDEWPSAWWVEKFHEDRETVMKTDCILGHLGLVVSSCQVTQGTHL